MRFLRFLIAGGVNTIFGFTVYSLAIAVQTPIWAALLTANIAGVAFNFVTTGNYVFRSLLLNRFPRFIAAYLALYLINWALISWLRPWIPNLIYAQAILTIPLAMLSYWMLAHLVYPSKKSPPNKQK